MDPRYQNGEGDLLGFFCTTNSEVEFSNPGTGWARQGRVRPMEGGRGEQGVRCAASAWRGRRGPRGARCLEVISFAPSVSVFSHTM